jgi:hypothetical protein
LLPAAGLASLDLVDEPFALEPFSLFAPSPEADDEDPEPPSDEDDDPSFEEESFFADESFSDEEGPSAAAAVSRWRLRVP